MTPAAPRLPNFFIAGAPNTGTTSLHAYLQQHPQIYMSPVKEPTYFGAQQYFSATGLGDPRTRPRNAFQKLRAFMKRSSRARTWDAYLELFRGARDEPAIGEASPRYLILPDAPRAIHARIPHARLIFLLRDPAEWLLTRYLNEFWPDRRGSFRTRFLAAMQPENRWAHALLVGRYATHLQRFLDVFPRDQIQVHLYEDLQRDGAALLRRLLAFLNVDPDYPISTSERHNPTVVPRLRAFDAFRRRALRRLPLTQWLPAGVRRTLRGWYYRPRPPLAMDPADRAIVIDYYRGEIERTAALIGRDLSAWLH